QDPAPGRPDGAWRLGDRLHRGPGRLSDRGDPAALAASTPILSPGGREVRISDGRVRALTGCNAPDRTGTVRDNITRTGQSVVSGTPAGVQRQLRRMDQGTLLDLIAATLRLPVATICEDATMQNTRRWDSLRHILMMTRI